MSDEELYKEIAFILIDFHTYVTTHNKVNGKKWEDKLFKLAKKYKEKENIVLRSDMQWAIGYIQGLGHNSKYLEKRYPLKNQPE